MLFLTLETYIYTPYLPEHYLQAALLRELTMLRKSFFGTEYIPIYEYPQQGINSRDTLAVKVVIL